MHFTNNQMFQYGTTEKGQVQTCVPLSFCIVSLKRGCHSLNYHVKLLDSKIKGSLVTAFFFTCHPLGLDIIMLGRSCSGMWQ